MAGETAPNLVHRFYEANQSQLVPNFQWKEALIIHIERDEKEGYFFTAYELSGNAPIETISREPFKGSILNQVFLENKTLKLGQNHLQNGSALRIGKTESDFQLIPIALLSSPVGILVTPYSESKNKLQEIFNRQLHLISGMVRECLFADLRQAFAVEQLKEIEDVQKLIITFSETLARWLNPCEYSIFEDEEIVLTQNAWCDVFGNDLYQFQIEARFPSHDYCIKFKLPSTWNPLPGDPEFIYQLPESQMRILKYQWGLGNFLESVYHNWKAVKNGLLDSLVKKIIDFRGQIDEKIEQFERIKRDIAVATDVETFVKEDFGFYRENRKWIVRFNSIDLNFKIKSEQGMEAIRILLENENQHFSPLDLDKLLIIAGYTYNKDQSKKPTDSSMDWVKEQELLDLFNELKKREEEIRRTSPNEQLGYWQYLINIVQELNTHSHKQHYMREWKRIKRELDKLSIYEEIDENFRQLTSPILKSSRKSGNEKNRRDSISKAIKAIIDSLEPFGDIHGYLSDTIVRINKGAHSPFIYVPELYSGKGFEGLKWQTAT